MNINTFKITAHAGAWLCVALVFSGAAGLAQDVRYNSMPGTDFAKYHTYSWVDCGGQHPNQITNQEIIQDINGQMVQKGLTQITSGTADINICYQVAIHQQTQWNSYGMGGFGFGGMGTATSSTINNGSLVLDMYDVAAKQLVWQGTATKTLNPSGNEQKNLKNLANGIAKLMKNFPPKAN